MGAVVDLDEGQGVKKPSGNRRPDNRYSQPRPDLRQTSLFTTTFNPQPIAETELGSEQTEDGKQRNRVAGEGGLKLADDQKLNPGPGQ